MSDAAVPAELRIGTPRLTELEGLLGDFLVEGEVGRTPRAAIYRIRAGHDPDRPLALKVALQPIEGEDLLRFQHEVRLLSEVRHPNVIEVYDFGVVPGGYPFLTMELLAEIDLMQKIQEGGDWDLFFSLALDAAAGLTHIHRHGIVHLDIKPANVGLVEREDGSLGLKIMDFGLAQNVRGALDRRIRGTLAYTAPEVLMKDRYDHRADLYSLGMTLFQLATGVLPSAGSDQAAIEFHLQTDAPDPQAYRADMPTQLAVILRRLLARDPDDRYPSAGKLLRELADMTGRPMDPAALALGEGRVLASRMVGRKEVMEALDRWLHAAARGEGALVLLEGPEGIGKSRVLREFRLVAAMQGARVAMGRALASSPEPLWPLRAALRHLGREPESLKTAPATDQGPTAGLLDRLGDELAEMAAAGGPLVLLLDDLQLAVPETPEWLASLAARCSRAGLLLVGARRTPAGESDDGARFGEVLRLEPLPGPAIRELVDASLGTNGLPDPLAEWLVARAQGYPSRLQQLLRRLIDERVLRYRQGEWKPSIPAFSRLAASPDRDRMLDHDRVRALRAEEQALLEALAVFGGPVRRDRLAAVVGREEQATWSLLSGLQDKGVLEELSDGDQGLTGFSQSGLARSIIDQLDPERLRQLRLDWAELLEGQVGDQPELAAEAAEHFWQAGERRRALPLLRSAAEQARRVFGYREAAQLYARVAEVATDFDDDTLAADARVRQAEALAASGSTFRALSLYRSLLGQDPPGIRAEDDRRTAILWLGAGRLYGRLGEATEQLEAARRGLGLVADLDEPNLAIELRGVEAEALLDLARPAESLTAARGALKDATHRGLTRQRATQLDIVARVLREQGEIRKAEYLLRRALVASRELEDERLAARTRGHLAELVWGRGEWRQARELLEESLSAARRMRDPWTELAALHAIADLEIGHGDWKAGRAALVRSLEARRKLGARDGQAEGWLLMGETEEMLGDWEAADRHYRRVLKGAGDRPSSIHVAATARMASLARKRGDWSHSEGLAREALSGAERLGDVRLLIAGHWQLGLVEKDREHLSPAAAHLARALELASTDRRRDVIGWLRVALGDLDLRRGEVEDAEEHLQLARSWAKAQSNRFVLAQAHSLDARVAVARRDPDRAEALFGEAVKILEELEVPFEYARALYEWGVRTRNPEVAVERLDRALVAFERLGAATDFERTRGVIEGIKERHTLTSSRGHTPPGIWEVAKVINTSLDLDEVLERTMDLVLQRLGAERGMVVLANRMTGELEVATTRNLGAKDEGYRLSETVVRRVIEDREPVLVVDALTDPRFAGAESIVASHIVSIICVPLVIRDRLAGAIYVDHLSTQHLFSKRDLGFVVAFADQAAIAIDNARLYGRLEEHRRRLSQENESLRREIFSSRHLGSIIGKSAAIVHLKETLERVAPGISTILIRGESGTGKGLVARTLHSISPRRDRPFVHFSCAALPETLVESELFGHEKGAFTGAVGRKPGRFELAHEGTIFLDEIGKISRSIQGKLLRVVEDREFERVGGTRTLRSDVRIVAATNLNLEEAIANGEFREDLYYRLNIIPIVLPPLRERREDIPFLADHFLERISRDLGQESKEIGPEAMELFMVHRWPGNVRELEAAIHRALVLTRRDRLGMEDFQWIVGETAATGEGVGASGYPLRLVDGNYHELSGEVDRLLVAEALRRCGGRIRETARFLGVARNTLKTKLKRYELEGS